MSGNFIRVFGQDNANPIATSNPLPVVSVTGTSQSNITSETLLCSGVSQLVTLTIACPIVTVINYSTADPLYVNFSGGTATSSSLTLPAGTLSGASIEYTGDPIQQFTVLGTSGQTFGVCAF